MNSKTILLLVLAFSINSCGEADQSGPNSRAHQPNRTHQTYQTAEEYVESGIQRRENFTAAIADFTRAIEIDPDYARAYDKRGRARAAHLVRDYHGAIEDFTRAIEIDPEYTLAYMHRGFAKIQLDNHRGAIDDYTKAIEVDPEYAVAYYQRGISRVQTGERNSGCSDLHKAGELGFGAAYKEIREHCN